MRNKGITIVIIGFFHLVTSCKIEANLFPVDSTKIGVEINETRGTIFNNNYPFRNFNVSDIDSTSRWTPNKKDIELAEKILRQNIWEMNKNSPNQIGGCPKIHRNLNKYFRQYVGIENKNGQKVIHINFYWDRYSSLDRVKGYSDHRLSFESDYAIVFDGCSYYWQINVNLDKKTLSDFSVNGVA